MWAVAQHHPDVVRVLLSTVPTWTRSPNQWTSIRKTDSEHARAIRTTRCASLKAATRRCLFAAQVGNLASARLLVEPVQTSMTHPPRDAAPRARGSRDHPDVRRPCFLDRGADANAAGARLHRASRRDHAPRRTAGRRAARARRRRQRAAEALTPIRRSADDYYFRGTGGRHAVLAGRPLQRSRASCGCSRSAGPTRCSSTTANASPRAGARRSCTGRTPPRR